MSKGFGDLHIEQVTNTIVESSNNVTKTVQLPILNLPRFEGDYNSWLEFRDSFLALVDKSPALSNVEKLHHLRSCLRADALDTIRSIPISNDNYPIAWRQLVERYERNHLITSNHVLGILNFAPLKSGKELRRLYNTVKNNLEALRNLGAEVDKWDLVLIPIIATKVDSNTRKEWERISIKNDTFTVKDMLQLLQQRCEYLERLSNEGTRRHHPDAEHSKGYHKTNNKQTGLRSFMTAKSHENCPHCSEQHFLFNCQTFLGLPTKSRQEVIRQLKVCYNCLKPNHISKACVAGGCKKCGMKHNTLLHQEAIHSYPISKSEELPATVTSAYSTNKTEVLLSTAIIRIMDKHGKFHTARALLDSGSQSNFISKKMFNKLGFSPRQIQIPVKGINQASLNITEAIGLSCKSRITRHEFHLDCLIIPKITDSLPQYSFPIGKLKISDNINLADPTLATSRNTDILIGASPFWELLCIGQIRLSDKGVILQKTRLGWVASGAVPRDDKQIEQHATRSHLSLEERIERFWKIEEFSRTVEPTSDEAQFEHIFRKNLKRRPDGHFEVALPLKENYQQLGDSLVTATKRFLQLEKRLNKCPETKEKYINFIREYRDLGHMSEVTSRSRCILPHHGVVKQDSITTKLRVVFYGSAKTDTGVSINDVLMHGKQQQDDLFNILLRFRKHTVIITSDIEKMYRQVYIKPEHRDLQRILWRESPEEQIREFQLNTVTYGTKCGSFLAIRCLHEIADRISSNKPSISNIIRKDFYVDDLLTGAESAAEVLEIRKILTNTLANYGFHLRKWNSNDGSVVNEIKRSNSELKHLIIEDNITKTLGVLWNAKQDNFQYALHKNITNGSTKRFILSTIAQIFDPIGLIGPITVIAKLLMQDLWKRKLDWDESLPQDLFTRWKDFQANWEQIKHMEIPRHAFVSNPVEIKIHGFCDASQCAYGACIYLHSVNKVGKSIVRLLCAKSRVAPVKTISLPRLELCGALLLSKLIRVVIDAMQFKYDQVNLWTDSQIVLSWIAKEPGHWKTFAANRVAEIHNFTEGMHWRHVRSTDNPADIISRGMNAKQLAASSLWWNGPSWISSPTSTWPMSDADKLDEEPEKRESSPARSFAITSSDDIFSKYSSFRTLQRVIGYLLRFTHNALKRHDRRSGILSPQELENSLAIIVKLVQAQEFKEEIRLIQEKKYVSNKSNLSNLNPILDKQGILRVGGRIHKSNLAFEEKHPIILPSSHRVTYLIIKQEHHRQLHAGAQTLLYTLRLKFWIIRGLATVKKVLRNCITCFKVKPRQFYHQMGELPSDRITQSFPFSTCGVDYSGPIEVKESRIRKPRMLKAYMCIFVCFITKAVHIELAIDLTSEAFINVLKRFICPSRKTVNHLLGQWKELRWSPKKTEGDVSTA